MLNTLQHIFLERHRTSKLLVGGILFFFLSVSPISKTFAGIDSGGGDVIVCIEKNSFNKALKWVHGLISIGLSEVFRWTPGAEKSLYLADLFEVVLDPKTPLYKKITGIDLLPRTAIVRATETAINSLYPEYAEDVLKVRHSLTFVPKSHINELNDDDIEFDQNLTSCWLKKSQLAVQTLSTGVVQYSSKYLNLLSPVEQELFYYHEAFIAVLKGKYGIEDSKFIRKKIQAIVLSTQFSESLLEETRQESFKENLYAHSLATALEKLAERYNTTLLGISVQTKDPQKLADYQSGLSKNEKEPWIWSKNRIAFPGSLIAASRAGLTPSDLAVSLIAHPKGIIVVSLLELMKGIFQKPYGSPLESDSFVKGGPTVFPYLLKENFDQLSGDFRRVLLNSKVCGLEDKSTANWASSSFNEILSYSDIKSWATSWGERSCPNPSVDLIEKEF